MSQFIEMFGDEANCRKDMLKEHAEEMFIGPFGSSLKNDCFVEDESKYCVVYEQKHAIDKDLKVPFRYVNKKKYNELKRFTVIPGDIIVSCRGTVGEVFLIPEGAPIGIMHPSIMKIRLKPDYLPEFFVYALTKYMHDRERLNIGTGIKMAIKANDLGNQSFPFPSVEEQKKFVSIARQADKSEFGGSKSQFIEMFGGGNWPQKTLGEVGSFTRGGGFQKSDFVEHGIPCIHYGQIHTKFGPFITSHITEISSDLESKTKFASKGDLVIAITSEDTEGSCKSTAWLGDYPVAVGGHAAIYKHSMNPLYMSFFFKSTLFNYAKIEYVHGTKVFEIKPDDIAKILVPCPPMSLQNQFSAIAEQSDKSGSVLQYMIAC